MVWRWRSWSSSLAPKLTERWTVLFWQFFAAKEFLLAMPCDALPQEMVDAGSLEDSTGIFGPSCREWFRNNSVMAATGEDLKVLIVDCAKGVSSLLSRVWPRRGIGFWFQQGSPYCFAKSGWASCRGRKVGFRSLQFLYCRVRGQKQLWKVRRLSCSRKRQQRRPGGGEGIPSATGMAKPKRMTTAALASSVESLITAIPRLTDQPQMLADRQQAIEDHVAGAPLPPRAQLAKPLQESFSLSALYSKVSVFSTSNCSTANYGFASSSDREARGCPGVGGQNQSDELTTLVSEIAAAGQDPLNDLAGAGSSV